MNTRLMKRILAAIAATAIAALVLVTDVSPASAHESRKEFACQPVDSNWSTYTYCDIQTGGGTPGVGVPNGHKLCFAVRGSAGHDVVFRATSPAWTKTTNRGINFEDGQACLSTNNAGRQIAQVNAKTTDGSTVSLGHFTAYIRHP